MNPAYRQYLTDALTHYENQPGDADGIQEFINWVERYKPGTGDAREPDTYQYGEAWGQYPVGYLDTDSLKDAGIDIDALADEESPENVVSSWAEEVGDQLTGQWWWDRVVAQLDNTLENLGIDPEKIRKTRQNK